MRHTLLIPLVGPMQAWGTRSRFDDRDSHPEPTKSGVIGLVCAALGRRREEPIDDLAGLRFGVRVDQPGIAMSDYQTAQGVLRASGSGQSSVTSRRHYVADACFLAGLEGADLALLAGIEARLRNPVWCLSLGRKSYALTVPPYLPAGSVREGASLEAALEAEPWHPMSQPRPWETAPSRLRIVVEDAQGEFGLIADNPMGYDTRRYGVRKVRSGFCDSVPEVQPWSTCLS